LEIYHLNKQVVFNNYFN